MSGLPPFFARDGERFVPSPSARGPWSPRHQHGGPPAALLARAFAREAGAERQIARLTFDFLRPVPLAPLTVATRVLRAGGKALRLAGTLIDADGVAVIEATCLALSAQQDRVTVPAEPATAPPPPERSAPFELPFMSGEHGYHRAVEWRIASGTWGRGPVTAWLRLRVPLVAESPTSTLESLVATADSASGVAVVVDPARTSFVNGDLTIALHRLPAGEWTGLEAATVGERHGIGLTRARLWDPTGPVGQSLQSLLLERRDGGGG